MSVLDALHEIEMNARADLLRKVTNLQHATHLTRAIVAGNGHPSGRQLEDRAGAVAEAIDIWAAAKVATANAEAAQLRQLYRRPAG